MIGILVDEDLPRSLVGALRAAGRNAVDVRDAGLRGRPDSEIQYALANRLLLLTADMGFANILQFPTEQHHGIVIVRFPNEVPTVKVNGSVIAAFEALTDEHLSGNIVIIEPGRIRMRRRSTRE